jgi:hypothetical protein
MNAIQQRIETVEYTKKEVRLTKPYSLGPYNKCKDSKQWIRISEGCPNNCPYCAEPTELKYFGIPEIQRNKVKILDMNLIAKKEALATINELATKRVNGKVVRYEFICGIDYRFLTAEIAEALNHARFENIRIAWDWAFSEQKKIKAAIWMLCKAGYNPDDLMVFMICNWKMPYSENCRKLDLLKIWGVKAADCYYDNQTAPNIVPIHWTDVQITDFRSKVRKHNQLVNFKIDPEVD